MARTPNVCMPGIHIHIQQMKPRDTSKQMSGEPVSTPASRVMVGSACTPTPSVRL